MDSSQKILTAVLFLVIALKMTRTKKLGSHKSEVITKDGTEYECHPENEQIEWARVNDYTQHIIYKDNQPLTCFKLKPQVRDHP